VNDSDAAIVDLIRRARAGDREALGELLDAHRGYLRGVAEKLLNPRIAARIDASDVVQQTCLSIHKRIGEFDGEDAAQFVAWLRQVHERNIQNVVRDQLRAQKRAAARDEPLADLDAPAARQTSPSRRAMRGEEAVRLSEALAKLPQNEQQALRLRYLEGRTLGEVCLEMGLTKDALVWLMKRAMKKVKDDLADD
jgi:RNA polymerase sigma-70 factor, ECF subfamily